MTDHESQHQAAELSIEKLDQVAGGATPDALQTFFQMLSNAFKAQQEISRNIQSNLR